MKKKIIDVGAIEAAFAMQKRIQRLGMIQALCFLGVLVQVVLTVIGAFDEVIVDSYPEAIFHLIYPFIWIVLVGIWIYCHRKKKALNTIRESLVMQS